MAGNSAAELGRYQAMRRFVLLILILVLGAVLIFGSSLQSDDVHDHIETYGVILIVAGIGGRLWSILYIGGRKSVEVISEGPYSITRNPLYFFSSIAAAGAGAQMGSFMAMVGFGVLCALAFHIVIRREERYLAASLGTPYRDYVARVPRFFPNPFLYRDMETVTFRPAILRQTLLDGLVFFVSIPAFELIERGQDVGFIPIAFWLY